MRQALIALILSAGLLAFPVTALADSDKSNKHKRFNDHHHQKHDRAIHDYRSERRQHKKHHKRHRIEKNRHFNGDNYRHWKSRRQHLDRHHFDRPHFDRRHFNKNHRHYKPHHRHGLKHRLSSHNHHDREYLEWVAIMLILNEALDNDYR